MRTVLFQSFFAATFLLTGCNRLSVIERNSSAGFNGGYEIVKSGLPVNWHVHYPPIKHGDAEISYDTVDPVEGNQSLRLTAHRADSTGGWRTAGLFQLLPAEENKSYQVTFWLKNNGSKIALMIASEKPMEESHKDVRTLGEADTGVNEWRKFEYAYTVPETYSNIRFDLTLIQPGTVWIDDVRIEELQAD